MLVVGGLFASRATTVFPVLKYIPNVAHAWIGWLLILVGIIQAIVVIAKAVK